MRNGKGRAASAGVVREGLSEETTSARDLKKV